jgi:hypothetical protein
MENSKKPRPIVPIELPKEDHLPKELFQNEVLRPILKLQNAVIVALFYHFVQKMIPSFKNLTSNKKDEATSKLITQNTKLKNLLIGIVVGQMNEEEFTVYLKDSKAFDKRIVAMGVERVQTNY